MSKLSQMIDYSFTGDGTIGHQRPYYLDVSRTVREDLSVPYGVRRHFKLTAKVETSAWLDEDYLIQTAENQPAIRQHVLNDLKRAMIEDVFGEFRPLIIEMRAAIYDKDDTRLRNLLATLEQKMFVE